MLYGRRDAEISESSSRASLTKLASHRRGVMWQETNGGRRSGAGSSVLHDTNNHQPRCWEVRCGAGRVGGGGGTGRPEGRRGHRSREVDGEEGAGEGLRLERVGEEMTDQEANQAGPSCLVRLANKRCQTGQAHVLRHRLKAAFLFLYFLKTFFT